MAGFFKEISNVIFFIAVFSFAVATSGIMGRIQMIIILINVISIVIDSSTIGVRDDRLACRARTNSATPATGLIVSDERFEKALLDQD